MKQIILNLTGIILFILLITLGFMHLPNYGYYYHSTEFENKNIEIYRSHWNGEIEKVSDIPKSDFQNDIIKTINIAKILLITTLWLFSYFIIHLILNFNNKQSKYTYGFGIATVLLSIIYLVFIKLNPLHL
ncbi:hypothetical protein LCL95_04075 [Bacillus timonensis]|nr:hypothetical protein [Bacillus timonensis]